MKTISSKVSDEFYLLAHKVAKENNLTVSSMIKQAFETSRINDKSIELKILKEINLIGNELSDISQSCNIKNVVDMQVLLSLSSLEEQLKNIRKSLDI